MTIPAGQERNPLLDPPKDAEFFKNHVFLPIGYAKWLFEIAYGPRECPECRKRAIADLKASIEKNRQQPPTIPQMKTGAIAMPIPSPETSDGG